MKKKAPGTIVGDRYEVEKILGEGAMGVVYRASDTRLDRPIALKLIALGTEEAEKEEMKQRVLREAQTPAKMNHPGIVTIYDYGVEEDYAFIAMEFVEGRTLESFISQYGRIPLMKTVEVMEKICDALRVAHDLGFIHRDIKPANIMILRDGSVKVMDFGLAKGTQPGDLNVTKAGMLIGTPKYMSPEQIRGRSLDGRTDIYSLGVVLFEMLTGKTPYTAKDIYGLLNAVLNEECPAPSSKHKKIPRIIDTIVLRSIQKKPDERYQTVNELSTDLRASLTKLIEKKKMAESGRSIPIEDIATSKRASGKSSGAVKLPTKPVPSDEDLGIPDLDTVSDKAKAKQRVSKSGEAMTLVSTMALQDRWNERVEEEAQNQRENLCCYRFQSPTALQTFCGEAKYPKSNGGFCVLHDPSIDKSKLNIRKNLEQRVLRKQNLEGAVLKRVELVEAKLQAAQLGYADLQGAMLNQANLYEADFSNGNFEGTRFDRANLLSAKFVGANLTKASFRTARLNNAILRQTKLVDTSFQSAEMREADLKDAQARKADFTRAELIEANLQGGSFIECDFRHANLTKAVLKNASLMGSKLKGALFRGAQFKSTKFDQADLERADLSQSKLRESSFRGIHGQQLTLDRADLWGVDFSGADLRGANLQGADLSRANLTGANLEGANLKGAHLRKTILEGANLTNARLIDADLVDADMRNAKVEGIEISGADLTGAQINLDRFPVSKIPTWNQAIWDQATKSQLDMKSWGLD